MTALPDILNSEDDFGLPKENYSEVIDARTDFDFRDYERLAVAVTMMSYTAGRAWAVVSGAASAGNLIRDHQALWGDTDGVKPTCTASATGTYRVTWPASVVDLNPTASRVTTSAVQFKSALVTLHAGGQCHAVVSANTIVVYTATTGGVAAAKNFTVVGL